MHPAGVTALKWKPFECPYCHVTFDRDWNTAHFRPYPTFASVYTIRWAACSVCANPIITLEDEAGTAGQLADFSTMQYIVRAAHVLWPQTFRGIDPLTGVNDKQTFEVDLRTAIEDARRTGDVVSLVYCDIDFFKAVNDAHGHPTGDEVLRGFGGLLDKRLRGKGTVYRIGGEEFALLLPRFERDVASAQAESLRKQVEAARLGNDTRGRPLTVTSSFGVAAFPEDAADPAGLARKADEALYLAKQGGRNRVARVAEGAPAP
jgi:diguanylate cyclase (GGDEF)-like protein